MRRRYLTMLLLAGVNISLYATPLLPDTTNHLTLAQQYQAQGDWDQAIEYYQLAKTDFAQAQDHSNLVYVLTQLASLYTSNTATHAHAETYLDSAQLILKEKQVENDTLHALTWSTRAKLVWTQRKFYEAIDYYQKSLERKQAFYGENHIEVASDAEEIGSVYLYDLQNPHQSEIYHQQALSIRENLNDSSHFRTNCLYHLTYSSRLRGDFLKALSYGTGVLQNYESMPNPKFSNIVRANAALAGIYYSLDSIEQALNYNNIAINTALDKGLAKTMNMPLYYNSHSEYFFHQRMYDSAIYYANLAIAHRTQPEYLAISRDLLGKAYTKKGQLDSAFNNLQRSKSLKESIFQNPHTQLAISYIYMGDAFRATQELDSAIHYYKKALISARISQGEPTHTHRLSIQPGDDLESIQEVLTKLTGLFVEKYYQTDSLQYLVKAQPYFELFDEFMDLSRSDLSTEGSKLILSGNHKATYEQAIATYYHLYQANQTDSLLQAIFHCMEKSKAVILLESIYQTERYQRALPDSIVRLDQSLRTQLAYIQSEIAALQYQSVSSSKVSEWQIRRADVLRQIDNLNSSIQNNFPGFYELTYRNPTITIDSLKNQISDDLGIISYFWGDSTVYALLITNKNIQVHQIRDINTLQTSIEEYRDIMINDSVIEPSYSNFLEFQSNAYNLYRILIEPLLSNTNIKHLVVVADGDLTGIPFDSFVTSSAEVANDVVEYEKLDYLIKEYAVSYEFSASVAFREAEYSGLEDDQELNVVAFGIKDFSKISEKQPYPRLGGAEREVRYVQKTFPQANIFLNADASEAHFKAEAPKADLLHIATHGFADLQNPFASRFIFYPEEEEDGTLNLYELYNIPLKAKILLLSACESGVGKHYVGEGNHSLARSFVYAGCESVVMSLWQINDIITEQMIKGIYDHLAEEQTTSTALRNAKLAFLNEGIYAHPQCWASMVPLGNASIELPKQSYARHIMLVLLAIGLISFLSTRLFSRSR
jgi:CHAT domain-containing protein